MSSNAPSESACSRRRRCRVGVIAAFALAACSSGEPDDGSHFGGQGGGGAPSSGSGGLGGDGLGIGGSAGAPSGYAFDLDDDGTNESDLAVAPCAMAPTTTCLSLSSVQLGDDELLLSSAPATALHLGVSGKHFGGALQAVYVHHTDAANLPSVAVFDMNARTLAAWVTAPAYRTLYDTYFALVKSPDGRRFPFLAPGQGYIPPHDGNPSWLFSCQFDPANIATPDPACGTGFRAASTIFTAEAVAGTFADPNNTFRHNGGWLDDVDGDGWEDIHLPYLWAVQTISGKTGEPLATTTYDVAAATEPASPPGFHSGRNYGSFTTFETSTGERAVLIAAGVSVGNFQDFFCNVSRYHAVLESTPGAPSTRHLGWSRYHSFVKNTFQSPYGPLPVIARPGDMMNGCVHRFSDSFARAGSAGITVYDEFTSDAPAADCVPEQYAEVTSGFAPEAVTAWNDCAKANFLPATGFWTVHVLDAETGAELDALPNAYVWGKSSRLLPSGETVYVVEMFSDKVRFDQVGHTAGKMTVVGIAPDFTWEQYGAFPVEGHPKLRYGEPSEGSTGATWSGIVELETTDADGDGLDDVELENGQRVGYSQADAAFVAK